MAVRLPLLRSALVGITALLAIAPASSVLALDPPRPQTLVGPELSEKEKVVQVMNRLAFGARPGEVDHILAEGGWQAWVKLQMDPDKIDDSACEKEIAAKFPWATKTAILDVRKASPEEKKNKNEVATLRHDLPKYVLFRAVNSNRRFTEVMADFWRNHFCVDLGEDNEKTRRWTAGHYENQVIRKHLYGKFKSMLFDSARHPAMLEYLDNQASKINNWNENYAREVMELHTLGADRGYTNDDVRELSKVLTGWQYDEEYKFAFNEAQHQPGIKNWLGYKIPAGYSSGEQALYYLCTHKYTAEFLATKLCRYLVNDNPPPALVKRVASKFQETEGDLPKVYKAIIESPEFFARENFRSKFKTPFQFVVSALRATDAKIDDGGPTCTVLGKMGQPIYSCPDPTGYFDQAERWMDAGVLTGRWDYAWALVRGSEAGVHVSPAFLEKYTKMDAAKVKQAIIDDVVGGDVGDRERKMDGDAVRLLSIMLGSPSFQQR